MLTSVPVFACPARVVRETLNSLFRLTTTTSTTTLDEKKPCLGRNRTFFLRSLSYTVSQKNGLNPPPSSINTPFLWKWVRYIPSGQPHSSRHLHYGGIRISQSGIPVEDYSTTPQQNEHGQVQVQVLVLVGTRVEKTTAKGNSVCAVLYCSCSCAERKGKGEVGLLQCAVCMLYCTPNTCSLPVVLVLLPLYYFQLVDHDIIVTHQILHATFSSNGFHTNKPQCAFALSGELRPFGTTGTPRLFCSCAT